MILRPGKTPSGVEVRKPYHRARQPHSYRTRLMLPGGRDVQSCRAQAATIWTISQRGDDAPLSPDPFTPNGSGVAFGHSAENCGRRSAVIQSRASRIGNVVTRRARASSSSHTAQSGSVATSSAVTNPCLQRLLPRADPAHVQPRGAWHRLAVALRKYRLGTDGAAGETTTVNTPTEGTAPLSGTEFACVSLRHWEGDLPQAKIPTGLVKAKAAAQFAKVNR